MIQKSKSHADSLPRVDCVVIGVNAAGSLGPCIESIQKCNYPGDLVTIIYVDGGSHDNSIAVAESYGGVKIIRLRLRHPTPGLGRNSGWKHGTAPLVQFLDSDTLLDPDWLLSAVQAFEPDIAAVMGYRREINPEESVFNWIADLEWNGRPGDAESFGGDVLVRRGALLETGGYDEELVGGEDPELSRRIRQQGWRIRLLDAGMTRHDLAMTKVSQYLKRAYRSGYGFAAVVDRFRNSPGTFWKKEFRRIVVRGGGFLGFSGASFVALMAAPYSTLALPAVPVLLGVGLLLLLFPRIFRVGYFQQDKNISYQQAKVYAWHCSLVVLPDIFGVARYYWGKLLNRPLRNRVKESVAVPAQKCAGIAGHADE
jgi:glycosyltransferase involved in cell wall biosynthesis